MSVPAAQLEWWRGASQLAVTTEETEILCRPPDPYDVLVRDRGILYLPWTWYAKRLNQVFGIGAWTLMPLSEPRAAGNSMTTHYALLVRGGFVGEAWGQCEWREGNTDMSRMDAVEGAKSNAIARICKSNLGMGLELWDKQWREAWKQKYLPGKPARRGESEYDRPPRGEDEARAHMDAIARER